MKSLRTICLIILAVAFVLAVVLICIDKYSSTPKLSGWNIQLDECYRYDPVEGSYVGVMSDEDCRTIWNIWKKYDHKLGVIDNIPDVFFRIVDNKEENNYEYFAYDDRDGSIQYCKVVNNKPVKGSYSGTTDYLSEEDQVVVLAIIEKYRSELVKWTLEIGQTVGQSGYVSKYELSYDSIKAFSDMWKKAFGYNRKSDETIHETTEKDPHALFTITLHNYADKETYFICHAERSLTLEYVATYDDTSANGYYERHQTAVLTPEYIAMMWKIIEEYTGHIERFSPDDLTLP